MGPEMVFNALSCKKLDLDIHEARRHMALLVQTLVAATSAGTSRVLRTTELFEALPLAAGYQMTQWRNDPAVEREQRQFLRRLATKSPVLRDTPQIEERMGRSEFTLEGIPADGETLWRERANLFPSLDLCEDSYTHIGPLKAGDDLLRQLVRRLREMDAYCTANWKEGAFDYKQAPGNISPDSSATLEKYGEERTMRCSDGTERLFSLHSRLTPGAWRLYVRPKSVGKLFIGPVGPHLRTVKFDH